jgi:hypothetical protein
MGSPTPRLGVPGTLWTPIARALMAGAGMFARLASLFDFTPQIVVDTVWVIAMASSANVGLVVRLASEIK